MTNLFPVTNDELDVPLGNGCYVDFFRKATPRPGPRQLVVYGPGGGFGGFDRRTLAVSGGALNYFAGHVLTSDESNFDVASIGTPQSSNLYPTVCPHLPPIVPTPTGFIYPIIFDLVKYALEATISTWAQMDVNNDPDGVVMAGASARAHAMATLMYRFPLPVKAFLGLYATPDMRKDSAGVDIVHNTYWRTYFGLTTEAQAAAVPMQQRKDMSPMYWISRGQIQHHRPSFLVYEQEVGDGVHAFGDPNPARPHSAVHDSLQLAVWKNALVRANLPHKAYMIDGGRNSWETAEHGDVLNPIAEQYLVEQL